MHIEYRWHCEYCGATLWTKTSRTPEAKGCPDGPRSVWISDSEMVYCHEWEGEEKEVRNKDD